MYLSLSVRLHKPDKTDKYLDGVLSVRLSGQIVRLRLLSGFVLLAGVPDRTLFAEVTSHDPLLAQPVIEGAVERLQLAVS